MIKTALLVVVFLVSVACANVAYFTYQPVGEADRKSEAGAAEGSFIEYTSYYWERELDTDVTMKIYIDATSRPSVALGILVYVQGEGTFAMLSPTINVTMDGTVADTSVVLEQFRLGVYGKDGEAGYTISKLPTEQIRYTGLNDWWLKTGIDRYKAEATLAVEPPSKVTVILPDMVVNGELHRLAPIPFTRRELEGKFKLN